MSVDFVRKEYEAAAPLWEIVTDVCAGQEAIKSKDRITLVPNQNLVDTRPKKYLPAPNMADNSPENQYRYSQYLERAVFYNATGRTLAGLVGTAFRRSPEIELGGVDYLLKNADGQGVGLFQQTQSTLSHVLKKGRHGLWVDYPVTQGGASRADMEAGRVRANILSVTAESVINWRTEMVGASSLLTLVVMQTCAERVADDGYSLEEVEQYRVLRLDNFRYQQSEDGLERVDSTERVYSVELYESGDKGMELVEAYTPQDGAGKAWEVIPFTFVGATDNNATVDPAPLYDMAVINIAHYRNSADYEDSVFYCGQAQLALIGYDQTDADYLREHNIYVGSRTPLPVPLNGDAKMIQAEPNTLVKEAMSDKEQQMIALGARLVSRGEVVKTATEAQGDQEAEHSVLSLVVENVSEAYTTAVMWAARFMNVGDNVYVEINRDFNDYSMDAQKIQAIVAAWQAGAVPLSDMLSTFQRSGLIDSEKQLDEIEGELEASSEGLGLDAIPATD